MLRTLGHKIPDLLAVLCHGGLARYGTAANTLVEANERVLFLGRLGKAIKDAPGYVPCASFLDGWCVPSGLCRGDGARSSTSGLSF